MPTWSVLSENLIHLPPLMAGPPASVTRLLKQDPESTFRLAAALVAASRRESKQDRK